MLFCNRNTRNTLPAKELQNRVTEETTKDP